MPKVFVVNAFSNPIEAAAKYGQLEIITSGVINPFSIDRLAWSIAPKLAEFRDEDYLLLTGPGAGYILAASILLTTREKIRCLRYESTTRSYEELVISKQQITDAWAAHVPNMHALPGRIYVLNYSGHSIEPALAMSKLPSEDKLCVLTSGNIDQFDVDKMVADISVPLLSFVPGDFLLLSGPAILHIIAATSLWMIGRPYTILIYNPKFRIYVKREIDQRHIAEIASIADEERKRIAAA